MNKKAVDVSPLYWLGIGILLFIIVSCTMGNGIAKIFKSNNDLSGNLDEIMAAMSDVSNKENHLSYQLVGLEMKENTAMFIFLKDTDLKLTYTDEINNLNLLIVKPDECDYSSQCLCWCTGMELTQLYNGKNTDELNEKYGIKYNVAPASIYSAECNDGIECAVQTDANFPSRVTLSEIVSKEEEDRMSDVAQHQQTYGREQKYIRVWEGGFVIWRLSDDDQKMFQSNQFMSSQYVDVYVVNNNVNVKLCLDPACSKITNY